MSFSAEQAACQVRERLTAITKLVHDIDKEINRNDHTLNNIAKTHDKIVMDGKISPYYQQKLKSLYTTAVSDAEEGEDLIRKALSKIYEIRNICNERRIQMHCSGNKETFCRGDMMNMIQSCAQTLPLWTSKPGQTAPPLCGAVPAESSYVAKTGDRVAAFVINGKSEENWILAEVILFNADSSKYEVEDIDEEQGKERFTLSRRKVVPLPLMRANPETDPNAFFPERSLVMALYPQTTCFYGAIVTKQPQSVTDEYELLFEDNDYEGGYAPPLKVAQGLVIAVKNKKGKSQLI